MARKPRVYAEDSFYHVTARANRQELILEDKQIKELFIHTVKRAKKKYSFEVRNICIMGNHIHMDIKPHKETKKPDDEDDDKQNKSEEEKGKNKDISSVNNKKDKEEEDHSLSQIMRWILSTFAVNYNKLFNYKGHVWYDRFKSVVIRSYIQFIKTFLYIMNNPVRANIVNHPLEFAYNGVTMMREERYSWLLSPPNERFMRFIDKFLANYDPEKYRKADPRLTFMGRREMKRYSNQKM